LKRELNYLKSNKFDYLLADVVGKQLYNDQILVINKGTDQGLRENLAVTVGQGIVIGKIISALPQRSEVRLLTSPNSELAVTLNQEVGTNGVVKGKAGNGLAMEFIPQNLKINDGDLVVTSGLEENIPRGLLVGKINGVESLVGRVFQKADVLPPFNYQNLQFLTIILQQ
jgi:rod shape-determining protein MreC